MLYITCQGCDCLLGGDTIDSLKENMKRHLAKEEEMKKYWKELSERKHFFLDEKAWESHAEPYIRAVKDS